MKSKCFLFLAAALAFGAAATAQVRVQPVKDVHSVVIEDAVTLKVYVDSAKGTELEVNSPQLLVAKAVRGVLTIDGNTKAVLRLAPDSPITHFSVQDAASLELIGSFDFGNNQFTISAEDAGRVKVKKVYEADTLRAGYVILHGQDNARIVSEVPLLLTAYSFHAEDASHIEMPSADVKPGAASGDKTYEVIVSESGKVVVRDRGEDSVVVRRTGRSHRSHMAHSSREEEVNWFWGFNNWGSHPFSGFGGTDGDAAVSYRFMNYGLSLDIPLIDKSHFGLYAGLGLDGNDFHFDGPIVNLGTTGFQASGSNGVSLTGHSLDSTNWNTYLATFAVTVPVTFSFEPWQYDKLCIRLSAIPGVNVGGILSQRYRSKSVDITSNNPIRKHMNPFMLDARLTLMYNNFGLYAQVSTLPFFKRDFEPLYPVKFGVFWTLSGR